MKSNSAPRRHWLAFAAALACSAALPLEAQPAAWPSKPELVVGYAAGGATDVITRRRPASGPMSS